MGRNILMICTSGTSATSLSKVNELLALPQPLADEQILNAAANPEGSRNLEERLSASSLLIEPELHKDALSEPDFVKSYIFPSAEAQTILRWLSAVKKGNAERVDRLRIILLPTNTDKSILTSEVTTVCLNRLRPLFENVELICGRDKLGIIPLSIKVDTRDEFLPSIANLFSKIDELVAEKDQDEEVIICSTGGYKAVSGFAMLYAQLHSMPCLYSFEITSDAYELMSIPLGYAYSQLDEEINMLKAVSKNAEIDTSSLPQWVKDSGFMAGTLLKSYTESREKPYGLGEELFRRLRACNSGNEWAEYLQELLRAKWGELWQGDQIPETVEHSRRHSKRLMELAANFFRCAGEKISVLGFTDNDPKPLALLIASIYLHDIGHTALSYPVNVSGDDSDENLFPLGLFPSAVRELHHLLTGEILRSDPERYFMCSKYPEKSRLLAECVPLIAAHHRGYTVLRAGQKAKIDSSNRIMKAGSLIFGSEKFAETLRPLEEKSGNTDLLKVTALLRVLDGCDVQSDRVISPSYLEYRNQRSADEARLIQAEIMSCIRHLPKRLQNDVAHMAGNLSDEETSETCKGIYSGVFDTLAELKEQYETWRNVMCESLSGFTALSLANRLAFKREQHLHFRKHLSAGFVLPVMSSDGKEITIKIFPNEKILGDTSGTLDEIVKAIDDEYEAVADVLEGFPALRAEISGRV